MKQDPSTRKSVDLKDTRVWRENDNTITMAGSDFKKAINIRRSTNPTDWAKLDLFLKSHGK